MDLISVINLFISIGTFIIVIVKLIINNNQRKVDREIDVIIGERRRMQQELFKNILGLLEIDREVEYGKLLKDKDVLFNEVLNYKVLIWINLNRENSFYEKLRSNCTELATWVASALEVIDYEKITSYNKALNRNRQHIWRLIDKYIEDEEKIIESIMRGESKKVDLKKRVLYKVHDLKRKIGHSKFANSRAVLFIRSEIINIIISILFIISIYELQYFEIGTLINNMLTTYIMSYIFYFFTVMIPGWSSKHKYKKIIEAEMIDIVNFYRNIYLRMYDMIEDYKLNKNIQSNVIKVNWNILCSDLVEFRKSIRELELNNLSLVKDISYINYIKEIRETRLFKDSLLKKNTDEEEKFKYYMCEWKSLAEVIGLFPKNYKMDKIELDDIQKDKDKVDFNYINSR